MNTINVLFVNQKGIPDWIESFSDAEQAEEYFINSIANSDSGYSEEEREAILDEGYYDWDAVGTFYLIHSRGEAKEDFTTLVIHHGEGEDIIQSSSEKVYKELYNYVSLYWSDLENPPGIESLSQDDAIAYYFEEVETEWYEERYLSQGEEEEDDENEDDE